MSWLKVGTYAVSTVILYCLFLLSLKPELWSYRHYFRSVYAEGTVTHEVIQITLGISLALFYVAMLPIAWPLAKLGIVKPFQPTPWQAPKLTEDLIAEAEQQQVPGKICRSCGHEKCRAIGKAVDCPECEEGLPCGEMKKAKA